MRSRPVGYGFADAPRRSVLCLRQNGDSGRGSNEQDRDAAPARFAAALAVFRGLSQGKRI